MEVHKILTTPTVHPAASANVRHINSTCGGPLEVAKCLKKDSVNFGGTSLRHASSTKFVVRPGKLKGNCSSSSHSSRFLLLSLADL